MPARSVLAVLLLLSAASICWSQDDEDSPAHRFFLIIDADRNGSIEPGEWDRFPPLKDYIGQQGVDFSQSMGFDEFARRQDGFGEALRARFEDAAQGGDYSDNAPPAGGQDSPNTVVPQYDGPPVNIAASATSPPAMRTGRLITTRSPVNHVLPDDYRSHDRNGDGQIGLYEWPRKEIAQFRKLDINNDGFLTPYEILYAQNKIPGQQPPTTTLASSSPAVSPSSISAPATGGSSLTSSSSSTRTSVSGTSSPAGSALPSDPLVSRATISFKQLDRDNNGSISGDEWRSSRTVRKMFEGASIDITQPMDKDKFIETFVRIVPR